MNQKEWFDESPEVDTTKKYWEILESIHQVYLVVHIPDFVG
jgi:hypothetical protein